jgi:hypothetical protein
MKICECKILYKHDMIENINSSREWDEKYYNKKDEKYYF